MPNVVMETVIVRWELFIFCNLTSTKGTSPANRTTSVRTREHDLFFFFLFWLFKLGRELLSNPHFRLPTEEALHFHDMVAVWVWVNNPQNV